MHGVRLVSTPAMNRIGSAVSGLEESCAEMCVKSKIVQDAEEGCYFRASLFAMTVSLVELAFRQDLLEEIDRARIFRLAEPE